MSTPLSHAEFEDVTEPAGRFVVDNLVVSNKQQVPAANFETVPGLTIIHNGRENYATSLSLALAGRMNVSSGTIALQTKDGVFDTPRQRFGRVALAGAATVDSLERQVPTSEIVREQIAWGQSALRRVPREPMSDERYLRWADIVRLDVDPLTPVGKLGVLDRLRLRIVLALIARPEAAVLVVDDLDQIKDVAKRAEVLADLAELSRTVPVVAQTVNTEGDEHADAVISLAEERA